MTPEHVWAVFKVSYDPVARTAQGGQCSTLFFVNETLFLTCHHGNEINSAVHQPNPGFPNVMVFLTNNRGDVIHEFEIVRRLPEIDVAIGRIRNPHPSVRACTLQTQISVGDEVFNLGFPSNQEPPDFRAGFDGNNLLIQHIRVTPSTQAGVVQTITPCTIHSNDVNLDNQTVAIMNYTSTNGFSGGPLVSRASNNVVGLMSFVIPANTDAMRPVVAIRMTDIQGHL